MLPPTRCPPAGRLRGASGSNLLPYGPPQSLTAPLSHPNPKDIRPFTPRGDGSGSPLPPGAVPGNGNLGFDAQRQPHLAGSAADPTRLHGTSSRGHHRWPPQTVAGVGLWSPREAPRAASPHGATYGTQEPKELLLKVPSLQEVQGPCLSTPCGIWGWSGPQKVKPNNVGPNPFFRGRTTPRYTASPRPSSPVFSWILEQAPARYFCGGPSPRAGATPGCCAHGLLPQAPRWPPQPPWR